MLRHVDQLARRLRISHDCGCKFSCRRWFDVYHEIVKRAVNGAVLSIICVDGECVNYWQTAITMHRSIRWNTTLFDVKLTGCLVNRQPIWCVVTQRKCQRITVRVCEYFVQINDICSWISITKGLCMINGCWRGIIRGNCHIFVCFTVFGIIYFYCDRVRSILRCVAWHVGTIFDRNDARRFVDGQPVGTAGDRIFMPCIAIGICKVLGHIDDRASGLTVVDGRRCDDVCWNGFDIGNI